MVIIDHRKFKSTFGAYKSNVVKSILEHWWSCIHDEIFPFLVATTPAWTKANSNYCKGFRIQVETLICMFQTVKNSQQWLDVHSKYLEFHSISNFQFLPTGFMHTDMFPNFQDIKLTKVGICIYVG